jgi:uncharacterized protein (TIGR02246 family)
MAAMQTTESIEDVVAELIDRQNDPQPFLALHTDDVVIVNVAGRRVLGKEALAEAMRGALASPLADVQTTAVVEDVRFLRPDVCLVSCTKYIHDRRAGGEPLPEVAQLTYVLVDSVDGWQVALAQTTPRQ